MGAEVAPPKVQEHTLPRLIGTEILTDDANGLTKAREFIGNHRQRERLKANSYSF
ncbi:MAG: hypothetical protein NZ959_07510 [Armatimonadetes bacterium]|nr:hypothetical protein [Armatimonadota bacterium]MDW8122214.1 hypothetical protein [Armatimonadota bacterium]